MVKLTLRKLEFAREVIDFYPFYHLKLGCMLSFSSKSIMFKFTKRLISHQKLLRSLDIAMSLSV